MNKNLSIGVFDSGMGGISVLGDLIKYFPNESFVYFGDSMNAPYGIKAKEEVKVLTIKACDFLVNKGVKAIVIACNTATSASIQVLREAYNIPIIGMEPAIKPAIEKWKEGNIAVMATPLTLEEDKFNHLLDTLSGEMGILKVPCPEIVESVENGLISGEELESQILACFNRVGANHISEVVLGCTHYIFVKGVIEQLFPECIIYDGNLGTVKQVERLLSNEDALKLKGHDQTSCKLYSSNDGVHSVVLMEKMLSDYLLLSKTC